MKFKNSIERRISGKHKENLRMINFKDKTILDIGCGIGIFEKYAWKKAKKIIAIEPCKKDLKIAKINVRGKKVLFKEETVEYLKGLKEKVDIVAMFDVIEHIPKGTEIGVLEKLNKTLKENGKIILSTPYNNFTNFLDIAWYFGHRHYTKNRLKNILTKSGFKIKKIYCRGGFFEMASMILFYPFKWLFDSEIPFKDWFDKKRDEEYKKEGFVTLFAVAEKV